MTNRSQTRFKSTYSGYGWHGNETSLRKKYKFHSRKQKIICQSANFEKNEKKKQENGKEKADTIVMLLSQKKLWRTSRQHKKQMSKITKM